MTANFIKFKKGLALSKRSASNGFTLIELLIVIAVLGILAIAVISAINPIEQINRSRDTGSRSDSEQLIGAVDRYYATQGYYPWQTGATDTAGITLDWVAVNATWADGDGNGVLAKLGEAGTGELKSSFTNRIGAATYNTLYVYNDGATGSSTYACFLTKSKSFLTETKTRCTNEIPTLTDFPDANACVGGTPEVYYSCLP